MSDHGTAYKLTVGWWWAPTKWMGRTLLWIVCWPFGLWRSLRHHQDKQAAR